jgi:hypothetical protein
MKFIQMARKKIIDEYKRLRSKKITAKRISKLLKIERYMYDKYGDRN